MKLQLKEADMHDAEDILNWRNDETTRANSFSKDIISYDCHIQWYERKLIDENCYMYIMQDDEDKIGQIRIDKSNDVGEVSYMIAPQKRNMGYGSKIIGLCEQYIPNEIKVLIGLVEESNIISQKCFENNKYSRFDGGYCRIC